MIYASDTVDDDDDDDDGGVLTVAIVCEQNRTQQMLQLL